MKPSPVRARSLLAAAALAIIAYAASTHDPANPLLALVIGGIGVLLTSRPLNITIPRLLIGLATLAILLVTLARAATDGLDIHDFAQFVTWMIAVKVFDRRKPGDDAQLLAFSVFLAVASMLLSNGLAVGMLTLVYLPFVAYASMHLQLRVSHDKAQKLARRKVAEPRRVPDIRPAAGASAGLALARTSFFALILGFLFAAMVFVVVPRGAGVDQIGRWGNPGAGRVVSFADRVRVGTGGAISTSRTPVLHLRLTDSKGREIGGLGSVRYLRGAVLDTYEDGTWTCANPPVVVGEQNRMIPDEAVALGGAGGQSMVYQDILLLNTPREFAYIFGFWRPTEVRFKDPAICVVYRPDYTIMAKTNGGKLRYRVRSSIYESPFLRRETRVPTSWPSPIVAQVAAEILAEVAVEPDPARRSIADDALAINAFRQYFWDNYTYRLGEPPPPPGTEPIDWFLTQAERGHCEHYASALAALCRSVGIQARVITGYVAAEYNRSTGHYIVRESNAHAWVEAQPEPGIWRVYDATPPSDLLAQHGPAPGVLARMGRVLDVINYNWVSSIVSFDSTSRTDLLAWSDPATGVVSEKAGEVLDRLKVTPVAQIGVLALRIFLAIVAVVFGSYGLFVLFRRWLAARARRPKAMPRRIADADIRSRVRATPLYQEMLTALARTGHHKPDWQPLRAWGGSLESRSVVLAELVTELTDLFYIMRFGGRELTPQERAQAERLLAQLTDRASVL